MHLQRLYVASIESHIAVPSHGSNFMHLPAASVNGRIRIILQYPHTGRTSCIWTAWPTRCLTGWNCSTLTRVELHASHPRPQWRATPVLLQYPHTGRTSCIDLAQPIVYANEQLQYPHTGRTSCIR